MAKGKTNAMRLLDGKKISYRMIQYDVEDGKIDGISVAKKVNQNPEMVFKTLVTSGTSKNLFVFVIPVQDELDLKKAAKAAGEKKLDLIAVKDIQKYTGYIRGGCSPIGMKKLYPTFIDRQAEQLEIITISGGKIGTQIEMKVSDLQMMTNGKLYDVVKSDRGLD
ncbi:Cys-tRNA(Pro)/Cys-tRNA(Cys) deacylase [Oikeobacillus pervagus]|uniref:Cys-tRNA(Pro)/Cys-tRNA(Cys) deacylase n=1 Tax=Oikeobacillus pervagus TaxID=1325931 RepID=A0AAJ1WGP5_9BACI|nr:Cys-tRNA(Pro) deacylase [Oikeobacillus pervagus]MDQ0215327.1 Cys-tRNA(Pro)/Cys-tRNA(Cys) deacylase [Oikeobacillus pervagus]